MLKFNLLVPLMLLSSFLRAEEVKPVAAPADEKPWVIEATPAATNAQPGKALDINVRIVNNTDAKQTVYIRSSFWYAKSDNPQVAFAQWPKVAVTARRYITRPWKWRPRTRMPTLGRHGPEDAPAGDVEFRVGVTLKSDRKKGGGFLERPGENHGQGGEVAGWSSGFSRHWSSVRVPCTHGRRFLPAKAETPATA